MGTLIDPPAPEVTTELEVVTDALAENLLRKADAGGALVYAIYHHPRAVELIKEFGSTKGFFDALRAAQQAYRVGGRY